MKGMCLLNGYQTNHIWCSIGYSQGTSFRISWVSVSRLYKGGIHVSRSFANFLMGKEKYHEARFFGDRTITIIGFLSHTGGSRGYCRFPFQSQANSWMLWSLMNSKRI
jgi:hypothetical protein